MRRFLLATAAVAALALATPMAVAQYADSTATNPAFSTVSATPEKPTAPEQTLALNPHKLASAETAGEARPVQARATLSAPKAQGYQAQSGSPLQTAQTYNDAEPSQSTQTAQAYDDTVGEPASSYATRASADVGLSADQTMSPTMIEYAQEAGMAGVPMTAAEVCAPRDVSLAEGTSRLNRDTRQQLRFAADRASACEIQQVVIQAPDGRGAAVRETLIAHGVDESAIQVEQSQELGVEMTFAGVATSSEQYAAIFNAPQQYAGTDPNAATVQPSSATAPAPAAYGYQRTSYDPNAPATATNASYSPSPSYDQTGYGTPVSTIEPSQTPENDDTVGMNETEADPVEDPLY